MIYPCVESTIDAVVDDFTVRLWINHTSIPNNLIREQELYRKIAMLKGYRIPGLIKKIIEIVPNLNAVQVKEGIVGTVVYTTDFNTDIHG